MSAADGVRCLPRQAWEVVLDLDATGAVVRGELEGRFFHGYYDAYCYLPLCIVCGNVPLVAKLRTVDRDAADGAVEALGPVLAAVRRRFTRRGSWCVGTRASPAKRSWRGASHVSDPQDVE